MKYRAIIKQADGWWIGWLVDLPGVNGQEKTQQRLLESLRIGAAEMLETEVPFSAGCMMTVVDVPDECLSL
ncbi:MAG TPA: HicB family protein [Desulfobulbaceae bacterium]|nr:HicB family protein [Desulfobulbaceae bacterium]